MSAQSDRHFDSQAQPAIQKYYNSWGDAFNKYNAWGTERSKDITDYSNDVFGSIGTWTYDDYLNASRKQNTSKQGTWGGINKVDMPFYTNTYDWLKSSDAPDSFTWFDGPEWKQQRKTFNMTNAEDKNYVLSGMEKFAKETDLFSTHWGHFPGFLDAWAISKAPVAVDTDDNFWKQEWDSDKALNMYLGTNNMLDREDFDLAKTNITNLYEMIGRQMDDVVAPDMPTQIQGKAGTIDLISPTLKEWSIDGYLNDLDNAYKEAVTQYDNFNNRVQLDERSLNERYDTLASQLGMDQSSLRGVNINNIDNYGSDIRTELENAKRNIGTYSNDLYDWIQNDGGTFTLNDGRTFADARAEVTAGYDELLAQLDQIESDRDAQVANYSDFKTDMRTKAEELNDQLGGFGLMDWYSQGDDIRNTIRGYKNEINDFETDLNDTDFASILGLLNDASNSGSALQLDFDTEMNRYESSRDAYRKSLYDLQNQMGSTDWYNKGALDQQLNAAKGIGQQIGGYESDISELFDFSKSQGLIDELNQTYDEKIDQYNAEDQRIEDFRTDMRSQLDALLAQIGGVNTDDFVNAKGTLEGYDDQLDALNRQLRDFESELNPSFQIANNLVSDARGGIGDALVDVNSNRLDFDSRISQSTNSLENLERLLGTLENNGERIDYRLLSSLDGYDQDLDEFRADRQTYQSELERLMADAQGLGYDPESLASLQDRFDAVAGGDLGSMQQLYDDAMNQRTSELDDLLATLSSRQDELDGLAKTDEQGMLDLSNQLKDLIAQAAPFSGGRADSIGTDTDAMYDTLNDRLTWLYGERDTIEDEAKDLLGQFNERQYYDQGVVDSDRALLDALLSRIDEYGASQARDEFTAADTRLNSERQRIEADLEKARQAREAEKARYNRGSPNEISAEELAYLANWLNNHSRDDDYQFVNSAFGRAMGLGG